MAPATEAEIRQKAIARLMAAAMEVRVFADAIILRELEDDEVVAATCQFAGTPPCFNPDAEARRQILDAYNTAATAA